MSETTTKSLAEFIAEHAITMTAERADANPNMNDKGYALALGRPEMDHWRIVLKCGSRRMSTYFSKGLGHHGAEPTAAEVLDCLASDAAGVANADSFEDWAGDYGYDTDSRSAHKTYTICKRQAERLRKLLGDEQAYDGLLFSIERE